MKSELGLKKKASKKHNILTDRRDIRILPVRYAVTVKNISS